MEQIIFHIDVNSAFLSWSAAYKLQQNPDSVDLRSIPSVIGGDQSTRHGIVLAKSIPAKKYGIQTGEPIAQALKKCPFLVTEPSNMELYKTCSRNLMNYLKTLTSDIEQVSVDECYLDFTGISHLYDSPISAACSIKDKIYELFGFTVNIGISSNKLLAKMASDFEKPNNVHTLFPNEIANKMWPMPVAELYMAGHSSVATLHKLEIKTIGDLANADPALLCLHLKSHGKTLWEYANGIEDSQVESAPYQLKGIGNSTTLTQDVSKAIIAKKCLLKLSEKVGYRLRSSNQSAYTICVEIKYSDFIRVSHQMQLHTPICSNDMIYQHACQLFDKLWNHEPIRLLGIRTGKLVSSDEPIQMSLFDSTFQKNIRTEKLDSALDSIRAKYGKESIKRGSQL